MVKKITCSWDDGYPMDIRVAELMDKYGLRGTFYVPQRNPEYVVLSEERIKSISERHEIGGHTLNHVCLKGLSAEKVREEAAGAYDWLSDILGSGPVSFSVPKGFYTRENLAVIFGCGYQLVRTTEMFKTDLPKDGLVSTSFQIYEHSKRAYLRHLAKRFNFNEFIKMGIDHRRLSLMNLVAGRLERVLEEGGCLHIWGHSWEIEEQRSWGLLEEVFRLISGISGVSYCSNAELLVK